MCVYDSFFNIKEYEGKLLFLNNEKKNRGGFFSFEVRKNEGKLFLMWKS